MDEFAEWRVRISPTGLVEIDHMRSLDHHDTSRQEIPDMTLKPGSSMRFTVSLDRDGYRALEVVAEFQVQLAGSTTVLLP